MNTFHKDHEVPWVSCFLTRMLILYLERIGKDRTINYHEILNSADHQNRIDDPKTLLLDYNNWVPHTILKNLIQAAEETTSSKDVTYHAAKNYYLPNHTPSLLEIIAKLFNNVEQILFCSNFFAGGFNNYLKLQCLKPFVPDNWEVVFLSHYDLRVEPIIGSINLIRGNFEGFVQLVEHIEEATCIEELSQLKIETIVKEFSGYTIDAMDDELFVLKANTNKKIVTARRVYLKSETFSFQHNCVAGMEEMVVHPQNGNITILSPKIESDRNQWKRENEAFQITRGGTLRRGQITYALQKGQLFNAPYSRYRFKWRSKKPAKVSPEVTKVKNEVIPLLMDHFYRLRETQKKLLSSTIENKILSLANERLKTTIQQESDFFGMIGKSPKMKELFEMVRLVASSESTVLIMGETGTGKELLARAVHQTSPRVDRKFLAVNCAALSESILEAELFGYEKGAFTGALSQRKGIFESVNGGTLFLDEVGEISPATQIKLLRVLEEQEIQRVGGRETIPIDVRVISATNQDLRDLVSSGKFRSDLYYRLHVITLKIPPLRERPEDLHLLVDHYLDLFSRKCKKQKPTIAREALTLLKRYLWPGNIRELKNVIEHAVVMDRDQKITSEDVILLEDDRSLSKVSLMEAKPFHESIESYKRYVIEETLKNTGGNQTKAAQLLGLQRTYLVRLIRQLHISLKD